MRTLILILSVAGSCSVLSISGCLDSKIVGFEAFRGHSPLGFEAILLCSFLQLATGITGGWITHFQLKRRQHGLLGIVLLLFSSLLSFATYSFSIGGFLCLGAAFLAFVVKIKAEPSA